MPDKSPGSPPPAVARAGWWLWFALLLLVCYAPVLWALVKNWNSDPDMGHGFFVPVIAGFIAWRKRGTLAKLPMEGNVWGLALVIWAGLQLWVATLGAELFLARTAFVISIAGIVLFVGGSRWFCELTFPIFLLFFMVPIPAIIYNKITFPLQLIASQAAEWVLTVVQIPVLREGNVLELAQKQLNVVEACSGIRSLLSLSFLALVYGHFFETSLVVRVLLFLITVPVAIIANAGRVSLTGIFAEYNPDLAEGFFHSMEGWVVFMVALAILIGFHRLLMRFWGRNQRQAGVH